eukprot:CAMPEP_0167788906 /NCGR_PEP_ID=MMETSP0111_2-20121227/10335_1 /TAXON_ID=91324 /ORGANISM="Lotharella globosa, Strain CCCM811" /LENGTH=40 /DNA_ID= /DNA_START= /DNA_END= /DNA_ORIENTATION=
MCKSRTQTLTKQKNEGLHGSRKDVDSDNNDDDGGGDDDGG